MAQVELVLNCKADLGESPVCMPSGKVHFVDIQKREIHTFDSVVKKHDSMSTGSKRPTCVVPYKHPASGASDTHLLAALEYSLATVDLAAKSCDETPLAAVHSSHVGPTFRCNDGKVDPQGRLWFGTMNYDVFEDEQNAKRGRLYCLQKVRGRGDAGATAVESASPGLEVVEKLPSVRVSNGLAWDPGHLYFIDSPEQRVDVFDYAAESGEISNRRPAAHIDPEKGTPDGMTIDVTGKLWVAQWGGSAVAQLDPKTGAEIMRVPIPSSFVTSCAFGGPYLDALYVTTSAVPDTKVEPDLKPEAGGLFCLHIPGTRGASFAEVFTG